MKFLHLSDLHIGKSVNGFSMLDEQQHVFRQILDLIQSHRPHAVIIAGDVYDRAVPGIEAVRVFDDFLTELAGLDVAVLVVSGNHDSPERLGYASRLLEEKRLFLSGAFDGTMQPVRLTDEYGEVFFWLLPFIKPSSVRRMFGDREIETCNDAVRAAVDTVEIDPRARNVLVSHQFFTKSGVTPVRSESELNPVGGLDAVDAEIVKMFDYVALGHLHGAQEVGGKHIHYAGSPVKYSFSECGHIKSVTLVELGEKEDLAVTRLPLTHLRDMREIRGEIATLLNDAGQSSESREDYLRVILTDEEEVVDPVGKIRSVYPNLMSIVFENSRRNVDLSAIRPEANQTERLSPYELFREFFLEVGGSTMSEYQLKIVKELMESEEPEETE